MANKGYVSKEDAKKLYQHFQVEENRVPKDSTIESQKNSKLLLKIVDNCSEDQFVDYLSDGEMPPLKLQDSEMEALQGGCSPVSLMTAYYAVSIVATIIYTNGQHDSGDTDGKDEFKSSLPIDMGKKGK